MNDWFACMSGMIATERCMMGILHIIVVSQWDSSYLFCLYPIHCHFMVQLHASGGSEQSLWFVQRDVALVSCQWL
jgi:hypothetical protein